MGSISAGETVTVSVDMLSPQKCHLLFALYKDGRFVTSFEKKCDETEEKSISAVLPDNFEMRQGWTMKVFVWDDLSNIMPAGENFTVKL